MCCMSVPLSPGILVQSFQAEVRSGRCGWVFVLFLV